MNTKISVSTLASVACVAALTLGASGTAQAQDNVFWSIGMSSPGVRIGMSNAPVVVVQHPVYVQPRPVYVQPRPVYVVPRQVVYMPPQPVYYGYSGWERGHNEHGGYRGHGYRSEQRFEHRGDGRGEGRLQGRIEHERGGRSMVGAESHIAARVEGRVAGDMGRRH